MSAGKGDVVRPFSKSAWDQGYSRIDFSKRGPLAPKPKVEAPIRKRAAKLQNQIK